MMDIRPRVQVQDNLSRYTNPINMNVVILQYGLDLSVCFDYAILIMNSMFLYQYVADV